MDARPEGSWRNRTPTEPISGLVNPRSRKNRAAPGTSPTGGRRLSSAALAPGYEAVLADVTAMIDAARHRAARSVNAIMTATYWAIGRRIVEHEQQGASRAGYAEETIARLSRDLRARYGRGFGPVNLAQMKAVYLSHRDILQTASGQSGRGDAPPKFQTLSEKSWMPDALGAIAARFPLPWSHYVRLLSVRSLDARRFYEAEALRGGWTTRQLDRQIASQFYERTALSKNKVALLARGVARPPEEVLRPGEEIKEPYVLELLGLKDEYSETELEAALIGKLESFLLELGGDFTFVGRQRRLRRCVRRTGSGSVGRAAVRHG